ncbi:MAG: hypothetical protein VKL60_19420 [Sphaerospermopsis sp.]|nr:hypothetical protein [Sphaerospermopsis sp.]
MTNLNPSMSEQYINLTPNSNRPKIEEIVLAMLLIVLIALTKFFTTV